MHYRAATPGWAERMRPRGWPRLDMYARRIYIAGMSKTRNRTQFGAFALMISDHIVSATSACAPAVGPAASALRSSATSRGCRSACSRLELGCRTQGRYDG
jgi:hypothetical protein